MESKRRNAGIAELQFICCCIIVLRHSGPIGSLGIQENMLTGNLELFIYRFIEIIGHTTHAAVPTFFIISGFFYFSNFSTLQEYTLKIRKRVGSLVVPYFLWSFLAWLFYAVITHIPVISSKMNMPAVKLDLKSVICDISMSSYAPLWFLRVLFILCVLGIFFNLLLKHRNVAIIFMMALVFWNIFHGYEYASVITWAPIFLWGGVHEKVCAQSGTWENITGSCAYSVDRLVCLRGRRDRKRSLYGKNSCCYCPVLGL